MTAGRSGARRGNAATVYAFSARPGTPAAKMADQVSEGLKSDRLWRLQGLLSEQQAEFNARCVGRTLPVLFERSGRHPGQLVGRSPYLQAVHADGADEWLGRIAPVEISGAGPNSLSGVIRMP